MDATREIKLISNKQLCDEYDVTIRNGILFLHTHRTLTKVKIVLHRNIDNKVISIYRSNDIEECLNFHGKLCDQLFLLESIQLRSRSDLNYLKSVLDVIIDTENPTSITHLQIRLNNSQFFKDSMVRWKNDLKTTNSRGQTPLFMALEMKNSTIINELLSLDNIHEHLLFCEIGSKNNIFHYSIKNSIEINEKICELIGNPYLGYQMLNAKNNENKTPLLIACVDGNVDMVKYLLKKGASINSASNVFDENVNYYHSSSVINKELVDRLVIDSNIKDAGTPLHWCNDPNIIELLVRNHSCDINAKDLNGNSALHVKILRNELNGFMALLLNGADVDQIGHLSNAPIHLAIEKNNVLMVQALIVFGANINIIHKATGKNLRHFAAQFKNEKIIYILHMMGAKKCSIPPSNSCNEYCSILSDNNGSEYFEFKNNEPIVDELTYFMTDSSDHDLDKRKNKNGKKLLSLDGGGIRGLIIIQIMCHLESLTDQSVCDLFDWIAGTSTGGILALLFALNYSAIECRRIYFKFKDELFSSNRPHSTELLEKLLKEYLGHDRKMNDLPSKPRLLITATNVENCPPKADFFRNYPSANELIKNGNDIDAYQNLSDNYVDSSKHLWKIARATSAAPTYFNQIDKHIDGGLFANNPTLDLLTELGSINRAHRILNINEIYDIDIVVSIGTGILPCKPIQPLNFNSRASIVPRLPDLFEIIIEQVAQSNGQVVERARNWCSMLNKPFYRLNPLISENVSLNESDTSKIIEMLCETMIYLHIYDDQFKKLAELLLSLIQ